MNYGAPQQPDGPLQPQVDEFTFADLVRIGWKHRRLVAAITFVSTVIAVLYAITAPQVFTSSAVIVTRMGKQGSSALAQLSALTNIPGANPQADPSNYLDQVAQDELLLLTAIDRPWLYKGDSLYLHDIWRMKLKTDNDSTRALRRRKAAEKLRKQISVTKNLKAGTLTLTSSMPDPTLARDMTAYFVSLLDTYVVSRLRTQAGAKAEFIEGRIAEVKQSLESAESALVNFREKNVLANMARYKLQEARLMREMTMNQEVYVQLIRELESAKIEQKNDQPIVEILRNPEVPMQRSKPNKRRIAMMGLILGVAAGFACAFILERRATILAMFKSGNPV